jgi:hypothetical protein
MNQPLQKKDWEVKPVALAIARSLVRELHYAKNGSNTATYLHGLYPTGSFWDESCLGVAWWIPPTEGAGAATYPINPQGVLALSRLVIHPSVPKNGCSFLLARSVRLIDRKRWPCLVTYADDWRGHSGAIYKASNWTYLGKTNPEATYTIKGEMRGRKAGNKTYTHVEMLERGATFEGKHAKHKFALFPKRREVRFLTN